MVFEHFLSNVRPIFFLFHFYLNLFRKGINPHPTNVQQVLSTTLAFVLAEASGTTNTSQIIDGNNDLTPAYTIYEQGALSRVATIDFMHDNQTGTNDLQSDRTSVKWSTVERASQVCCFFSVGSFVD